MYNALIIDDEKPVVAAITALIHWDYYNIQTPLLVSTDGKSGLSVMHKHRPEIVFVDMNMPIMNGTEFLKISSVEYPDSKYIVISGYDDFKYAQVAIKNGAIDYILKPVNNIDLKKALEKSIKSLNTKNSKEQPEEKDIHNYFNPKNVIPIIKKYIDENYCEHIRINMFSDKYFMSKEYLSKLFKEFYGVGIYEYTQNQRMQKSKELLFDTELQIQEISEKLGYSNNNYFSKAFKNYFGISPSDFRKK